MAVLDDGRSSAPGAGALISQAWRSALTAMRTMPALFGSAALLSILIKLADVGVDYGEDQIANAFGRIGGGLTIGSWGIVSMVLDAFVLAPVAVAVHRQVLRSETAAGLIAWDHPRIWRFAGWMLLVELVLTVLAIPVMASSDTRLEPLAVVLFGALMAVISIRWLAIFPAVAVEAPAAGWKERILASWERTRGHFWRLALALLGALAYLIVPVVIVAVLVVFGAAMTDSFQALFAVRLGFELFGAALEPVSIALGAAVASWFYMWLEENPALPEEP